MRSKVSRALWVDGLGCTVSNTAKHWTTTTINLLFPRSVLQSEKITSTMNKYLEYNANVFYMISTCIYPLQYIFILLCFIFLHSLIYLLCLWLTIKINVSPLPPPLKLWQRKMPNMFSLALLVSGLAFIAGHKLDGARFGSSSSYFTVANQDVSTLEVLNVKKISNWHIICF